jgi:LuxR family maltose regulon positive regulatory protein
VVVGTKLRVPALRTRLVPRPELVAVLNAEPAPRLTLVSAPTGFGKTSLLAELAASSDARFAWVALDAGDDEPSRFWRYVLAGLEAVAPEMPNGAARRLRAPGVSIQDEVLPVLINDLAGIHVPIVLVLDDYHVITADEIHAGVAYLLDRLGPGVRLVLATQSDPPLRLGRLRALGELLEVRAELLRFDDEHAAALLNDVHGLRLTPAEITTLQGRTEGWVAGLNLAAMSLRGSGDHAEFMRGLPVDDRFLVDYLWEEVVLRQPREIRRFLMRTSVLERLSAPLCDAVAETANSEETLLELERSNLFVIALDLERRWLRYHHLFRALLLRQLERYAPDAIADLHRRASAWFADQGDMHSAIEHAISAGDVHYAADELQRHWLSLYSRGEATTLLRWIDRLPRDSLEGYPELALARAGVARAMGTREDPQPWFDLAERAAARASDPRRAADLRAGVARQRAMARLGAVDIPGAVDWARRAVELRPDNSAERPVDRFFLAATLFWNDERPAAELLLRDYLTAVSGGEQDVRRYFALALLAEASALRGDLAEADQLLAQSTAIARSRRLMEHPPTEQLYVAGGVLQLKRGTADLAEESFEQATTLARRGGDRVEIAHALLWLGAARARQGDATGARDVLAAARTVLHGARVPALVDLARALERDLRSPASALAPPSGAESGDALSTAELRVLRLFPSDLTYREMAGHLYVSINTVRTHAQRIRRKLGVSTRSEAIAHARRLELL